MLLPVTTVALSLLLSAPSSATNNIMLVVDNSGSMKQNDPEFLVRDTLINFVRNLPESDRVGILLFGTQSRTILPLTQVSAVAHHIDHNALRDINYVDQWTDTAAALEQASYDLKMDSTPSNQKAIVLLTDGIVDTGDKNDSQRRREWIINGLAPQAAQSGIRIFSIAFTQAADFEVLQSIALATGGDYYRILSVDDMARVFSRVHDALAGLSQENSASGDSSRDLDEFGLNPDLTADDTEIDASETSLLAVAEPSNAHVLDTNSIPQFSGRDTNFGELNDIDQAPPSAIAPEEQRVSKENRKPTDSGSWLPRVTIILVIAMITSGLFLFGIWRPKVRRGAAEAVLHDLKKITGASTILLTGMTTRIGRNPDRGGLFERFNQLQLQNPGISRFHAVIECRDDGYWLIDQESKNGCMVNFERVRMPRKLFSGDRIHIAKTEFIFELPASEGSDETILFGQ